MPGWAWRTNHQNGMTTTTTFGRRTFQFQFCRGAKTFKNLAEQCPPKSLKSRKFSWSNEILKVKKVNSVKTWWEIVPICPHWFRRPCSDTRIWIPLHGKWKLRENWEIRSAVMWTNFLSALDTMGTLRSVIAHNVAKAFLKSYCFYPIISRSTS